jgi:hypothetical protein
MIKQFGSESEGRESRQEGCCLILGQIYSTNATIAAYSDVDCNLNLPVQKPLFTASSILKLDSGIEV